MPERRTPGLSFDQAYEKAMQYSKAKFERIWTHDGPNNEFGLVRVPAEEPFAIHYYRTQKNHDFVLMPSTEDPKKWFVTGTEWRYDKWPRFWYKDSEQQRVSITTYL